MAMKLLIGYDGSDCAKAAIDGLRRAGLPAEAEAEVLTAADVWPPSPPRRSEADPPPTSPPPPVTAIHTLAAQAVDAAAALADEGAARLRACFPGWRVAAAVPADAPHWALVKRADEWRPDLVVVGSLGRSAAGRLILGSVSQAVVHHARCSVRIGRRHSPLGGSDAAGAVRIVVGVDGSAESAAAVQAVALRRWPPGSEASVIAAADLRLLALLPGLFPPTGPWVGEIPDIHGDGRVWARRAVDRAAAELREAGLAATSAVRDGDPKRVLVRDAEAWGADCIFVGARGLGRLERFLIGSVSATVAARAHCSVEVVRHE